MIRRFLWRTVRFTYIKIAKPILFLVSPDTTHSGMIVFANFTARFAPLRAFTRLIFVKKNNKRLNQTINGIKFRNPVGLSAGLDKNGEIAPTMAALGFGFSEVGSVTAKQCDGNPRPWFYRLPKSQSLVVNAGLGNHGSMEIIRRLRDYNPKTLKQFPIVLSVAKTNSQKVVSMKEGIVDYVTTVMRAKNKPFIQVIELNISCPNAYGGEPFTTPESLERLLKAIDTIGIKQPIWVKMPVDLPWKTFKGLLDVIVKYQVKGVTIANLYKDRSKIELFDDLPDTVKGNMSGRPTWDASNELIRQTYLHYGKKLTIIGVGGIFSAEDAYTKIRLGASLVEFVTGLIFTGPQLAAEINYDLSRLLKRDGYSSISQVIGIDSIK